MRRVRWGVLGAARIGLEKVIPGMQRGSLCEVVAIASRDPETARAAADRLGLAQLHQLRGRVGRAGQAAQCFVVADPEEISADAHARLTALVRERDGFALAEADLRQRGPGEFFGTRQAGLDGFQVGDLAADLRLLEEARTAAAAVLHESPDLDGPWAETGRAVESRWAQRSGLARVG